MRTRTTLALAAAAVSALSLGAPAAIGAPAQTGAVTRTPSAGHGHGHGLHKQHLCSHKKGQLACDAIRLTDDAGRNVDVHGNLLGRTTSIRMSARSATGGLAPSDIQSAYTIAGASSGGKTVAIVDAYGYPGAESDLATYRAQYGLSRCSTANGCLTVMGQNGSTTSLPKADQDWDGEQALDLDAVSAACPDCRILLVQARSSSLSDLAAAEETAARQPGVVAISNSYGGGDESDDDAGAAYDHPGIAITASTGDDGYQGPSFPASSSHVTAVGGTSLHADDSTSRGWTESAWSGAGSGCATENSAPEGQDSSVTGCSGRAMADVSAVADPSTGLATYGPSGWGVVGGTSLSAPLVAAMYALSGNTSGTANAIPYAHADQFNDVTDGSNGDCDDYCPARTGWDGPTGLGTPNGVGGL